MMDSDEKKAHERTGTHAISRRTFCAGGISLAALAMLGGVARAGEQSALRPPGGQDQDILIALCIRCQKCYEACPHHAIAPLDIVAGLANMRTPSLNFHQGYCDFCKDTEAGSPLCASACPTDALTLPDDRSPEKIIIGVAQLNTDWCLAYRLIHCRFCYDACTYEAITLDDNDRPVVIADRCNGCGQCENSCVSMESGSIEVGATNRAIVVVPLDSNEVRS